MVEDEEDEETNLDDGNDENEGLEWDDDSIPQGLNPELGDIPNGLRVLKIVSTLDKKKFFGKLTCCETE